MTSLLSSKREWHKRLEHTTAVQILQQSRPKAFPLTEVQSLTSSLLEPRSLFGKAIKIAPKSPAANDILIGELKLLENTLYRYEAALIGCLHLLTPDVARGYCNKLQPNIEKAAGDPHFAVRVSVYLQVIVVAYKADPLVVQESEAAAANVLLKILHCARVEKFPSAVKLLTLVADLRHNKLLKPLLPTDLLAWAIRRAKYRDHLEDRLTVLQRSQGWWEAHRLTAGLAELSARPNLPNDLKALLPDIFPRYPMWASWRPNADRIRAWETGLSIEHKTQLASLLALEGPDTSAQQRALLRFSKDCAFARSQTQDMRGNKNILDAALDLLDRAVTIGPASVNLFVHTCQGPVQGTRNMPGQHTLLLQWPALITLSAALAPGQDSHSHTLLAFLNVASPGMDIRARLRTLTSALSLLSSSITLQESFGSACALSCPSVLSEAQTLFSQLLRNRQLNDAQSLGVLYSSFCHSLAQAYWLHMHLDHALISKARSAPNNDDLLARLSAIRRGSPDAQTQADYLLEVVGGEPVHPQSRASGIPPPIIVEDPIWREEERPLNIEQASLRRALRNIKPPVAMGLATECLRRAVESEQDWFVKKVTALLVSIAGGSDQAVVNLTKMFGEKADNGSAGPELQEGMARCWRGLLLHLIQSKKEGILERLVVDLTLVSWLEWVGYLECLYGAERQGLGGFDPGRIAQLTAWRRDVANRRG